MLSPALFQTTSVVPLYHEATLVDHRPDPLSGGLCALPFGSHCRVNARAGFPASEIAAATASEEVRRASEKLSGRRGETGGGRIGKKRVGLGGKDRLGPCLSNASEQRL